MFDIFRKDKFEEKEYRVFDTEMNKTIKTKGIIHNKTLLAIRKTKGMDFVIDITVDEDILYANIKTEEIAKNIVLDERIKRIDWKRRGIKEEIMASEEKKKILMNVKKQYNGEEEKKVVRANSSEAENQLKLKQQQQEQQKKQQQLKQQQEQQKKQQEQQKKQQQLKQQQEQQKKQQEQQKKQQQLKQQQEQQKKQQQLKQQQEQQKKQQQLKQQQEQQKKQQEEKRKQQQQTNKNNKQTRKIKTKQEARNRDFYIQKNEGRYDVYFIESEGYHQRVLYNVDTYDGAVKMIGLLERMYDWKGKAYPEYLKNHNVSGSFVTKNIQRVNKGLDVEKVIPKEVMIEMFFSEGNKITERYGHYLAGMEELSKMVGLQTVKNQIDDLTMQLIGMAKRGVELKNTGMHMLFSGPAGTGKTVVANIITQILYSLGYLDKDVVVKATREVLVGEHIGSSEKKTIQKIEEAMGGVLFIDEAYSLYKKGSSNDFGIDVVNVLIKEMEDRRGQFIVIMAGYEREMEEMIRMNPGLESRIKKKIDFEDYSYEELVKIASITKESILQAKTTKDADDYLSKVIKNQMQGTRLDGNARAIRVILENIATSYFADVGRGLAGKNVTQKDIEKIYKINNNNEEKAKLEEALAKLEGLYGLEELKESVDKFIKMVQWEKRKEEFGMGKFEMDRMHMAFMGPAGTAKTTVAEIMAEFLTAVGLLKTKKIINVTRKDLVGQYVGHTAPKVKDAVERAMGGVLFIDEAYSLVNGENDTFGNEAVTELIALMERHKSEFVVILAGYQKDIEKLMSTNEGFNSRIAHKFIFDSYKAEDICNIMLMKFKQKGYKIEEKTKTVLLDKVKSYGAENGGVFDGNGRWADNEVARMKHVKIDVMEMKGKGIQDLTKEEMVKLGVEEVEYWYKTLK